MLVCSPMEGLADKLVADVMRQQTRVCSPGNTLATAGRIMAEARCGLLPVLDSDDRLVAVITDRDICIALAQRERKASEVRVSEIVGREVYVSSADEDVGQALVTMRRRRVRRLPVVDGEQRLQGIFCLDDLLVAAWSHPASQRLATALGATLETLHPRLGDSYP
jgi:CBS domain-containing protein